jgi:demethylmenaquinone methyltransferase/2-methoxy-6-polyprenyl-1,4-benzoquinol methylase
MMMFENRPLQKMFTAVPTTYDFLNRLLTFGFDQIWRKKAAAECIRNKPFRILDLCCGTGDLSVKLRKNSPPDTQIMALDFSQTMLEAARKKFKKNKLKFIELYHADAAQMPFPDDHFDAIGIAFAFRNLTFHNPDTNRFLSEILRILKSDGRFVILETSQPVNSIFRSLFHWYLKKFTAPVGGLFSGHYGAYKYLAHSAVNYYNSEEIIELLKRAGFRKVTSKQFLAGISGLYVMSPIK